MTASPSQRRNQILKSHYEAVNLQLHVVHSFISTREGSCCVCGLPGHLGGLMSIPGVRGLYCSVECVECVLCGPGRCRWCSFRLDPDQSTFCSDKCRADNETSRFGSGKRFALWLARHQPCLFADLVGREVPTGVACLECGDNLQGKRHDSMFCSAKCRHRFRRSQYNPANFEQGDCFGCPPSLVSRSGLAGGSQS
jgi:hypothetical protein